MKIDRSTKLEDETGSTCELDLIAEGISIRTKNGKPFVLTSVEDYEQFFDALWDLKTRLEDRELNSLPGAGETEIVKIVAKGKGPKVEPPAS